MLFDLTFPCYLTTFSGKKCLSGKVICVPLIEILLYIGVEGYRDVHQILGEWDVTRHRTQETPYLANHHIWNELMYPTSRIISLGNLTRISPGYAVEYQGSPPDENHLCVLNHLGCRFWLLLTHPQASHSFPSLRLIFFDPGSYMKPLQAYACSLLRFLSLLFAKLISLSRN
jgi:hypothetical protein